MLHLKRIFCIQNTYLPAKYDMTLGLDFFFPSRLCLDALVHRCLSVGLTFQVLPGFTLNINHLYTQIFLVLSVTICHDQLVSGISNNEEFYTLACITGVIIESAQASVVRPIFGNTKWPFKKVYSLDWLCTFALIE